MSLNNEFQVTLPSNVQSNSRNKPWQYETSLPIKLDLPGNWEVALIDIAYPHNWTNLDKAYDLLLLTELGANEQHKAIPWGLTTTDLEETLRNMQALPRYQARCYICFDPGNYKPEDIVKTIEDKFQAPMITEKYQIEFNEQTRKVSVNTMQRFAIACYSDLSILQLLGFSKQTTTFEITKPGAKHKQLEYMVFETDRWCTAKMSPSLKRISNMFVYTDIIDFSIVGDTQAPILGFIPIQSHFGDNAHYAINPPSYVHVKEKIINTITIKICTDTGEEFPFEEGKVICRLNFRRLNYF